MKWFKEAETAFMLLYSPPTSSGVAYINQPKVLFNNEDFNV